MIDKIAGALHISGRQIKAVLALAETGATIPFMSRYRKEQTGGLDEVAIQNIIDEHSRLQELEKRRIFILQQIEEQGKLTPELRLSIENAEDSAILEDLYLPYKQRRKTKADVAREAGYEPLARSIFSQKGDFWKRDWQKLVKDPSKGLEAALQGARDIIAEWLNEDAVLRGKIRTVFRKNAQIISKVSRGKSANADAQKYKDYFDFQQYWSSCPSHRFLAMQRGESEGWLKLKLEPDASDIEYLMKRHCLRGYGESQEQIQLAMTDAWSRLLQPSLENEFFTLMKEKADEDAIQVFAANVKQLLLAAPLGEKRILAIDPGFRTGCKVVCLSERGELLTHATIFPHEPLKELAKSEAKLKELIQQYEIAVIAVGNGTAGRETQDWLQTISGLNVSVYMVNEAGASIYSASEVGREEFPDKDVTVRGAVSIGRRLADPMAELVKIDPKHIGVGQYQHDVNHVLLRNKLNTVVESAVNTVGVNLNTASRYLLSHVSGLGAGLAANIVQYRESIGGFNSREQLKQVPRLGDKAYEQCAGFLRIRNGKNPLDNSAVHPERYKTVKKMAEDLGVPVAELVGKGELIQKIQPEKYVNESEMLGLPTIQDILKELQKPGLDPRGSFAAVDFSDEVRKMSDLEVGMELKGVITNIVDFGAFADIGVKQDGLIHISQLSQKFIKHPSEAVSLGQHVTVRVLEVDEQRKRISLTMKF